MKLFGARTVIDNVRWGWVCPSAGDYMTNAFEKRLRAVDRALLTPLVQHALRKETAEVLQWAFQPAHGGFADQTVGGYGTYRFWGQARVEADVVSWSLMLKVLGRSPNVGSDDLADWHYWKREILAYQSGLLTNLPGGIAAPRCFAVVEYPNNEFWMWLEDIPHVSSATWSLERYAVAARHLGQFNGTYLMGHPLPHAPWLTNGRVRNWLTLGEPVLRDLRRWAEHPLIRHWLTGTTVERTLDLWAVRNQLLDGLDRLPRVLCHHDAFRRNLLTRRGSTGAEQTVAIDWQMVGTGAVGEELAPSLR